MPNVPVAIVWSKYFKGSAVNVKHFHRETLNMSLEVEEEERRVGRFSADILCRDTATAEGDWVVIENQLETTDHSHLGQIITYAAGLEAKTCIWVWSSV
ncbi:MAG: hypothetical protein JKY41_13615 [Rhodobacteraceae bacterium]|nr:hypothetical protein [Paracoccaceae bacterium]